MTRDSDIRTPEEKAIIEAASKAILATASARDAGGGFLARRRMEDLSRLIEAPGIRPVFRNIFEILVASMKRDLEQRKERRA